MSHVMVPDDDGGANDNTNATAAVVTCKGDVCWVLEEAPRMKNGGGGVGGDGRDVHPPSSPSMSMSTSSDRRRLNPSYRHDPTLLPQQQQRTTASTRTTGMMKNNDGDVNGSPPSLIASELLALRSVWRLSSRDERLLSLNVVSSPPPPDDPPPPSFLRRFIDANLYDWVRTVGDDVDVDPSGMGLGGSYNKPGVIVKRDDKAGYTIIDKPPNIPVHARIDNTLENMASCVGRMLWMERWGGSNSTTTMLSSL
ncbi:hypothetical protein ACHAW5_005834 [Stephanodiscus triporus]|uniref:Pseudouridine synthase RsuA/RluA-like domain-containing protein n=1 Tax=Stephanodiscus triporus TaxID=2934178 RepID=A0ABD3QP05_9STRA